VKKFFILVVAVFVAGIAAVSALRFAPSDSVLCVGSCKQDAQRDFRTLYYSFMEVATTCGGDEASRKILAELSPDLADAITQSNAVFVDLAAKDKAGTLSVRERADYLRDPLRAVPEPINFAYLAQLGEAVDASETLVVKSCSKNGFILGRSGFESYCDDFAQLSVFYDEDSAERANMIWSPRVLILGDAMDELFDELRRKGVLSARKLELRDVLVQDIKAREIAEEAVASSPAKETPESQVDQAIDTKFKILRCQSWAALSAIQTE
jgi:hypothetical protein